uniref:YLP motif-containing protein 1 n=1 Tax=Sinocyclocheilus grahami TaxID=75366 RepID=A0A672MS00_SINGR
MHPSWGGYGGGHQPPPHFGPRPHQFREAQPPAAAAGGGGGLGGYGAPSNFSSLQEQHLQQMQQLQQLHLKQLQSVLHHPGNAASGSGPPNWQAAPPNSFQDPSALRGPAGPPQPQPQPQPAEGKPPAPEPSSSSSPAVKSLAPAPQVSEASALVADEKPDFSSMSLQPSGITDTGDPAEAARLQQLQAAAAHWQHVQHQRASIQYQALMQEHAQLQQVLQQYQQLIQQPAHLQTMPLEMQLQHYEMQQQRFVPLYQEWDRHFNLWLEQFQAYPHKDQLHDYEAQWRQWQEQMNSTSAHLQERVTTLRAMKHQYGTASSPGLPSMPPPVNMDAMPGPSPQAPPPSGPVIPQGQRFPSSSSDSVSETGKTAGPLGPVVRPPRPPGPPGPYGRFDEEYYEDPRERRPPVSHREHLESTHPDEHWEEERQEYWEEEDPYWTERRPPIHARPPFPPGAPRRPPFHPRFMLHGPRRPPTPGPPHGPPHMGPRGVMGPRFRRGLGPWGPPPRHDMMERDMRQPPPPHEILAREPAGPLGYEEEMDREPGWTHPRGRGLRRPPLPAHEIARAIRRPPMRPTMARERWHGLPPHEEGNYEEEYPCGAEDDAYRRPTHEYHEDYEQDDEYYSSREEWGREQPDREYPPCRPPEHIRDDHWLEGRERSFPYEDENRYREERRGPPYADDLPYQEHDREPPYHSRSDWERIPPPPPPERAYSHPVDERPPPPTSLPPSAPVAPPRVEKKPETKNAEDILKSPGRMTRPDRIVVIMRGLPGSGKSHVAKLIRDKEVECGGAPPRVLGLDDYFMTEVEKVEKDPDTGKRVKNKVLEYEYEPEMEDTYRSSMLKTFKKTLDDGFFPFIILDAINDKVKYFDQFWSAAKTKGFEVYLAEITTDHQTCAKRNIHGRTLKDITKLANGWESAPPHMVRLDIRSLLQDAAIEDVEMEDFNPSEEEPKAEVKQEDDDETDLGYLPKSKWEMDTSEAKLDKLDGLAGGGKRKRETDVSGMEDFLQLPDDYASRMSEPGKKRVRWADLEEKKDADRKRAIGFVVGQTDWEKITDESGQLAQRALNRTKYF